MVCILLISADPQPPSDAARSIAADKAALAPFQGLIGAWKGVGQPQRGSAKGSWSEKGDWAYHFADAHAELVFHAQDGKYFSSARLRPAGKADEYELRATLADGKTEVRFLGGPNAENKLVLRAAKPASANDAGGQPAQITIQTVANGDRLVMLYEQQSGDRFTRLAEVGFTREGVVFAQGGGGRECIVTGGVGTIPVQYKGETYYVCCSGCRELFQSSPETVLAEYRARKAQPKK